MKTKYTGILILTALLISGCTTTSILGLSRASYVDQLEQRQSERFADYEKNSVELDLRIQEELKGIRNRDDSKMAQVQSDLETLQGEFEELKLLADQVEELTLVMEKAGEDTRELQKLSDQFKARMETIYKDTLQVLVTALEEYIDEPEKL